MKTLKANALGGCETLRVCKSWEGPGGKSLHLNGSVWEVMWIEPRICRQRWPERGLEASPGRTHRRPDGLLASGLPGLRPLEGFGPRLLASVLRPARRPCAHSVYGLGFIRFMGHQHGPLRGFWVVPIGPYLGL